MLIQAGAVHSQGQTAHPSLSTLRNVRQDSPSRRAGPPCGPMALSLQAGSCSHWARNIIIQLPAFVDDFNKAIVLLTLHKVLSNPEIPSFQSEINHISQ